MVLSKEFIGLQVDFALKVSNVTADPIDISLWKYTGLARNFDLRHPVVPDDPVWRDFISRVSEGADLKNTTYDFYLSREGHKSRSEDRINFGCFAAELVENGTLLRTHFSPKEDKNGLGPLNKENRGKRLEELKHLFEFAKVNFPLVTTVGGFSWLYNISAYANLFPKEYAQSGISKEWYRSLVIWGQFLKSSGDIRTEMAVPFMRVISERNSLEELLRSFKYKPLETRSPINNFYEFYGVD